MDLHDNKDVAENYDRYLSVMYSGKDNYEGFYVNVDGFRERIYNAISYNPITQIMFGNWKFETLDEFDNVVSERIRPLKMRQSYKQEMIYLFELCGFEAVEIFGDYHGSTEETGHYIWGRKK